MEKHEKQIPICPLCLRNIPPDVPQSLHHLIPKLKGGKINSVEALKAHPRLSKFFNWVAKRPANFMSKVPKKRRT